MFGGVGHQHGGSPSTEFLPEAALVGPTSAAETSACAPESSTASRFASDRTTRVGQDHEDYPSAGPNWSQPSTRRYLYPRRSLVVTEEPPWLLRRVG